jgi:hypothetical protein
LVVNYIFTYKTEILCLDSNNEFLSKSLWSYIAETFLAPPRFKKTSKESAPLFEVISLLVSMGPLGNKNFLANPPSMDLEDFQRTDISMKPLGPEPRLCIENDYKLNVSRILPIRPRN